MDFGNNFLDSFIETICVFGIIGGIILGIQINHGFIIGSILFLFFLLVWKKRRKRQIYELFRKNLIQQWGKDHKEERKLSYIKEFFKLLKDRKVDGFLIDDISWRDLNMDSVFSKIDHTKSYPGMHVLYSMLREPIFSREELSNRSRLIEDLMSNKDLALEIQYPLSILGKKQSKEVLYFFKDGLEVKNNPLTLYRVLSYFFYLSLGILLFNRQLGFIGIAISLSINAWIYQNNKYKIEAEIEIFRYISHLLSCAENISKINTRGIDIKQEKLKELTWLTRKIYKNVSVLNKNDGSQNELQVLMDYINMFTLREAIIFYKTINLLNKHKNDLFEMYGLIGEIDTFISIASYKDSLSYYVEPEFVQGEEMFYLNTEDLYHPLLERPIPYTFEFNNRGALVTGSNASGKSTFLRTIGVNALFGQTMYFVLAKDYQSNFFKLLTSIGTTDSIEEGDSYFMAEAKSLKRIIDEVNKGERVLCILDEIFRGTNTAERISAASEVLEYMAQKHTCVLAATHDLELTTIVGDSYENYHFKEEIQENDIIFNYILHKGPTTSRNALAILKHLNYPKEIYEKANERVSEYIDKREADYVSAGLDTKGNRKYDCHGS